MATCTAPIRGHRTASGRANCPVCGNNRPYYYKGYTSFTPSGYTSTGSRRNTNSSSGKVRAGWAPTGSGITYTPAEIRTLAPVRKNIITQSDPVQKDVFLCHAWDDRKDAATTLYDLLTAKGISVWFSEKDIVLGTPLLREIDEGLSNSRAGIVLVTPAFLERIKNAGIAEKELSALLARDLLIPIVHNTTYEELRNVSPLLGSRSGLSTEEDSMEIVADKIAELFTEGDIL